MRRYLALPDRIPSGGVAFFDRDYYWRCNPDVLAAELDPLGHFIGWGVREKRSPHPLIDIGHMLAIDADLLPTPPTAEALHDVLCRNLVDPSPHFSLEFYRSQLGGAEPIKDGLLRHFLEKGIMQGLKPHPSFDPITYYCWDSNQTFDVRSALRNFVLLSGALQEPQGNLPTEGQAATLFRAKADAMQLYFRRDPLHFEVAGTPDLSVVVVLHDNFALTLLALASLRSSHAGPIELILIDSGSTGETKHLPRYASGATLLRFGSDIGFVRVQRRAGSYLCRYRAPSQEQPGIYPGRGRCGAAAASVGRLDRGGRRQSDAGARAAARGRLHCLARRLDGRLPRRSIAARTGGEFRSRRRLLLDRLSARQDLPVA